MFNESTDTGDVSTFATDTIYRNTGDAAWIPNVHSLAGAVVPSKIEKVALRRRRVT